MKKENNRIKLGAWRINEQGKKEYYEFELDDSKLGYWTMEKGQRVFKKNPNYNPKEENEDEEI